MSDIGKIITELQVNGISSTPKKGNRGRKGGAGPSDHRALTIEDKTVMVPVYNHVSKKSMYQLSEESEGQFIIQNIVVKISVVDKYHNTTKVHH